MRITYLHQHFRLPRESGGTRSWEFARRLARESHDVTVIAGGDSARKIEVDGISVQYVKAEYKNSDGMHRRIVSFLQFMAKATIPAVKTPADVVFATSTPLTVAVPGLIASVLKRKRFVFEVRDLWPEVPVKLGILSNRFVIRLAQWLEKFAYKRASKVIALSPGMAEGVLKVAPETNVCVIPNASDIKLFELEVARREQCRRELDWPDDRPVLVYAGSFGRTYLVPWVVRLASHLPEARVVILGAGASSNDAKRLATELGLDSSALLPGAFPKKDVAVRVAACDITISSLLDTPVLHVNSLNKVFDSLAAGRPIIFNHGGWLSELVTSYGAGWRVSEDAAEAAKQVRGILAKSGALCDASVLAAQLAMEQFDRERLYADFRAALFDSPDDKALIRPYASVDRIGLL